MRPGAAPPAAASAPTPTGEVTYSHASAQGSQPGWEHGWGGASTVRSAIGLSLLLCGIGFLSATATLVALLESSRAHRPCCRRACDALGSDAARNGAMGTPTVPEQSPQGDASTCSSKCSCNGSYDASVDVVAALQASLVGAASLLLAACAAVLARPTVAWMRGTSVWADFHPSSHILCGVASFLWGGHRLAATRSYVTDSRSSCANLSRPAWGQPTFWPLCYAPFSSSTGVRCTGCIGVCVGIWMAGGASVLAALGISALSRSLVPHSDAALVQLLLLVGTAPADMCAQLLPHGHCSLSNCTPDERVLLPTQTWRSVYRATIAAVGRATAMLVLLEMAEATLLDIGFA